MMISDEQLPMVAMPSMNDTHLEEAILINRLSEAIAERDSQIITTLMENLVEHTVNHFASEEKMMQEKRFPPYMMHKGEHDRALNEMQMQQKMWNQEQDYEVLKFYIEVTQVDWIMKHIRTMDTVTANFLVHGISPCGGGEC
jgi:hemerythrin